MAQDSAGGPAQFSSGGYILKDATVRRHHYDSRDELRQQLQPFVDAYNHARRLKTLRGLTPHEFICKIRTEQPARFMSDPTHYTLGPNI